MSLIDFIKTVDEQLRFVCRYPQLACAANMGKNITIKVDEDMKVVEIYVAS